MKRTKSTSLRTSSKAKLRARTKARLKPAPGGTGAKARQAAEAALERYTEVFQFAPIGYATLDRRGVIIEINHAGARLAGGERSRFIGIRFDVLVAPPSRIAFDRLLRAAETRNEPASCELDLREDLEQVPVHMTCAVLRRGEPRFMLAFEDISDRREKELALARSEQALREMNRRKDEFLAMLSHELRNPLSPIRTSIEVLRLAEPGSQPARASIDIIDRSTAHLTRLVDDLLDVSRITRGKIELRREPVELIALVERTLDDHRQALTAHRLIAETHFAEPRIWIRGDSARIVQVVSNVLGNAEKFTPSGGKIRITVERVDNFVTIRIKDTGVGIPPDIIAQLFEPFAQAPQSIDRNRGGLGLGLTMVKSLVELHGGRVSIRSAGLGKGTEVAITLPCNDAIAAPDPGEREHGHRRRVLIVEDMRDTALSLQNALQLKGHEVAVANTGKLGLELTLSFRPEVVLCDLGLPDIEGYAFAMHVRTHADVLPYLVALSGYARPEDVARAMAAGFDRHVAKPASLAELDRLLATAPEPRPREEPASKTLHSS